MTYRENYEKWLRDFADDTKTVQELTAISGDEKEIEDRFYCELSFGTAGMRGVLGAGSNRMNVYNVRRATKGLAEYILKAGKSERGVAIAYDSRRMSPEFARASALVLCANGIKTYLFDALRPVPILSYAVRHLHTFAGIVITASHNPPQYNGYKVYAEDGAQIGPEVADEITKVIRSTPYTEAREMDYDKAIACGLLKIIGNKEVDDDYIAELKTLTVQPELLKREGGKLKIVYTPLHGSGNVPVRRILREVGVTNVSVVKEQELPDPNFSTLKVPNPEDPAAFTLAMKLADETGADVIFGTDPDCDRLGVAVRDKEGKFVLLTGNQIGCLLLYYILSAKKKNGTLPKNGAVVKSIVSTELAKAICDDFGVSIFNTLTGFKFIGEKIQQFEESGKYTFLFGFEESYGFLSSTFVRDKDGVNASLLITEAACSCMAEGRTLYDMVEEMFGRYGYYFEKVVSTTMPGKDGMELMAKTMKRLHSESPAEIGGYKVLAVRDYLADVRTEAATGKQEKIGLPASDVLYYELENGYWLCIRPSGTEPKIKLYVNTHAKALSEAKDIAEKIRAAAETMMK